MSGTYSPGPAMARPPFAIALLPSFYACAHPLRVTRDAKLSVFSIFLHGRLLRPEPPASIALSRAWNLVKDTTSPPIEVRVLAKPSRLKRRSEGDPTRARRSLRGRAPVAPRCQDVSGGPTPSAG